MSYVSNAELAKLTISSWRRVGLSFVLILAFGFLIPLAPGWVALPLFLASAGFFVWSLVVTFFYVVTERGSGGVFHEPMTPKDVLFARFIIKEAIRA